MSYARFARGVRNLGGFAGGTSRLARPPAVLEEPDIRPTSVVCPGLIGELPDYYGPSGPHMLPDHSEVFFGTGLFGGGSADGDIHRLSFPALSEIESWTPASTLGSTFGSMCISGAGKVYTCEVQNGRIRERSTATAAGTDSLITWTLPDTTTTNNLGAADRWNIAWNPGTQRIMAVRHIDGFGPIVWSCDPATDEAELLPVTLVAVTSSFPPRIVCTGDGATWIGFDGTLNRIPAAGTSFGSTSIPYSDAVAVTHDNRCIVQTGDLELSTVDSALVFEVIACEEIYADPYVDAPDSFIFLDYGTLDPTGDPFALTYVDDAGNKVWQWPADA